MKRALADVTFWDADNGGRTIPLPESIFSCPLFFRGINNLSAHGYDCRMLVREVGKVVNPGDSVVSMPIVFLSSDDVFPFLFVGAEFDIWEAGVIGYGVISSIEEG